MSRSDQGHREPKISVLLPLFNHDMFVADALGSILHQTWRNFEVLVIDDGSADLSHEVALAIAGSDCRVNVARHNENLGISRTMAELVGLCSGDYVAFMSDDDMWEPTFLSRLVSGLETECGCVGAFCMQRVVDEWGKEGDSAAFNAQYGRLGLKAGVQRDALALTIINKAVPIQGAVFRRKYLEGYIFDTRAQSATDLWVSANVARKGHLLFVAEPLSIYRLHRTQETAKRRVRLSSGEQWVTQQFLSWPEVRNDPCLIDTLRRRAVGDLWRMGSALANEHRWSEAGAYFREFALTAKMGGEMGPKVVVARILGVCPWFAHLITMQESLRRFVKRRAPNPNRNSVPWASN